MDKTTKYDRINNLKGSTPKKFTSDYQPTGEAKSKGKQKAKALEQIKQEIIEKSFSKINALLEKDELTSQELRDIFKTAVDMSGYKKQTQELQGLSDIKITREIV